jgi:hypothetical protein
MAEEMPKTGKLGEARERERETTRFEEKKKRTLTTRLSNPDFNPPLKGHTPVSSIALES